MQDLIDALNGSDESGRIYAAQDMAETHNPDFAVHLLKKLQIEQSQGVRDATIFALRTLPCSEIFDQLFEMLRSPDAYLRNAVISIFGDQGKNAVSFLAQQLNHQDGEVRKLILDALFATGDPESLNAVRLCLKDSSVNVMITAIEYLGRLEDKQSAGMLIELFRQNDEPMLRIAVLESLVLIGDPSHIREIFSILAPNNDFGNTDPFYIPQMLQLSARAGDAALFAEITEKIANINLYTEDILDAIESASKQNQDFPNHPKISQIIGKMMNNSKD